MKITIEGQTPSQKNSKQIVRNSRTGKMFITSSNTVKTWQQSAAQQLSTVNASFDCKVRLDYMFYVKDNRKRDLDNMIASINDILQACGARTARLTGSKAKDGIISGDHWQVLEIGSAKAEIDKEHPRAEITITILP